MANENCLEGFKCPKCGSEGPFDIVCEAVFRMDDDGADTFRDIDWSDDSWCRCVDCNKMGTVKDFKESE